MGKNDFLTLGQEVISKEADALTLLSSSLDQSFIEAIELLKKCSGKLVVTGMGKSGHIGSKIAATFASTGTPAFCIHPGEANHGDLGMIGKEDVILAISNSGNTVELTNVLLYANQHQIPLIAITARKDSVLAKKADCVLLLPPFEEACPLRLAPTTSTTMTLALGDALAVVLLKEKGFTRDNFYEFHPGGSLAKQFLLVADLMHGLENCPCVGKDSLMQDALIVMSEKGFGVLVVTDAERKILGIITDGDLRRCMDAHFLLKKAGDIMTPNPHSVKASMRATEALEHMQKAEITTLLVADERERLEGILHIHDCLKAGLA